MRNNYWSGLRSDVSSTGFQRSSIICCRIHNCGTRKMGSARHPSRTTNREYRDHPQQGIATSTGQGTVSRDCTYAENDRRNRRLAATSGSLAISVIGVRSPPANLIDVRHGRLSSSAKKRSPNNAASCILQDQPEASRAIPQNFCPERSL